ncbi:hypothetical protein J5N97_000124 [Dioscorea zingiberensis]|uniref:Pentatricopeptide repeat-containing protein n=1 Tax=Dioscorea zingiberensis TaxID=325984 RepID=A0A9D5BT49_9LILI|nr:hypothetical protein J5N97_000124 [Dioscorea zingiberensis]
MHSSGVPIDTYALCSSLTAASSIKRGDAGQVFDEMPLRNTVCANALLSGYGDAKLWTEAVELIRKMPALSLEYDHFTLSAALRACAGLAAVELGRADMLMEGISPDGVAFVTVISACARTGQLRLGIEYFESMELKFSLKPGPEHYSCLVDLLCRAGELGKAWKLVDEMLNKGHSSCTVPMWGALLNACKDQGDLELGKLAAQRALELNPHNDGIYVLLSNLYARFGMWHEINHLRELMKEKGLRKDVGYSGLKSQIERPESM